MLGCKLKWFYSLEMSHFRVPFLSSPWCLTWGCSPGQVFLSPFMRMGEARRGEAGPRVQLADSPPHCGASCLTTPSPGLLSGDLAAASSGQD